VKKVIALFLLAVGIVYSELSSDALWQGYVAPGILFASLLYLFWFKRFVVLTTGIILLDHINLESTSVLESIIIPLFFLVCVTYILVTLPIYSFMDDDGSLFDGDGGCDGGGD